MDVNFWILAACIGVSLIILIGVAIAARRATVRALVWWVGLACVPIGLLLGGAVPYVIDAWNRLAEWFQLATVSPIPPGITAGLVVLGVGIVLMLASRLIPFRPRKKLPPKSKTPPKSTATRGRPIYDSTSQSTSSDTTTTP